MLKEGNHGRGVGKREQSGWCGRGERWGSESRTTYTRSVCALSVLDGVEFGGRVLTLVVSCAA